MRQRLRTVLVVVAGVVLCVWLCYRCFVIVPISAISNSGHPAQAGASIGKNKATIDGVLSRSEVAEMGMFAKEPRFRHMVNIYVDDLVAYRKLHWTEIAPDDPAIIQRTLAPILSAAISHSCGITDPPQYSPNIVEGLGKAVALSLCRCAGMTATAYVGHLGSQHVYYRPNWHDQFSREYSHFFPGRPAPPEDASQAVLSEAFFDLDKMLRPFWNSDHIVAISTDRNAVRASISELPASEAASQADFISHHCLTPSEKDFFEGGIVTGELVMTAPPDSTAMILPATKVLHGEVWLIVKTRNHDMYPMAFYLGYDIKTGKWWLQHVNRFCSLRMISSSATLLF
jgi:hypothetical protein